MILDINNYAIRNILYYSKKNKMRGVGNLKSLAQQNLKGDVKFLYKNIPQIMTRINMIYNSEA